MKDTLEHRMKLSQAKIYTTSNGFAPCKYRDGDCDLESNPAYEAQCTKEIGFQEGYCFDYKPEFKLVQLLQRQNPLTDKTEDANLTFNGR